MPSLSAKDRVSLCQFTFADGRRCRTPRAKCWHNESKSKGKKKGPGLAQEPRPAMFACNASA
jgi:hypothetical protein